MAALVRTLAASDHEALELLGNQIQRQFLDGECYEFALALSEGLGWPMVGIIAPYKGNKTIRHVVLSSPQDCYFDARGHIDLQEIGEPFGLNVDEWELQPNVTRSDLEALRPINEHSVAMARRLAESYWPTLDWKDSAAKRALSFAEELEALSRKHGIWIFGHLPTTWPGLSESDGENEQGYTVAVNSTGLSMRINRRLRHEK